MRKKIGNKSRIFLCLLIVAMLFAVAGPMNVSAGSDKVPFKGNFDGATVPRENPDLERIEMSGKASHLGKYKAVVEANVEPPWVPGSDMSFLSEIDYDTWTVLASLLTSATFTAANGDELYADLTLEGVFDLIDKNFPSFTLDATITGGTGHFVGATGFFTGTGGQTSVPGDDNDLISGKFAGTISAVGNK